MEYFAEYFEVIGDTERNSVVFLYKKQIPQKLLEQNVLASLSMPQMYKLSKRAEARFADVEKRAIIRQARELYMEGMMEDRPKKEVDAYKFLATADKWARFFKRSA